MFGCVIIQGANGAPARDTGSVNDPAIYIVHFQANVTDALQQDFVSQLIGNYSIGAKIIAEFPNIKCLTARLSETALKWVRILSDLDFSVYVFLDA